VHFVLGEEIGNERDSVDDGDCPQLGERKEEPASVRL
jgi:hypothetical protein